MVLRNLAVFNAFIDCHSPAKEKLISVRMTYHVTYFRWHQSPQQKAPISRDSRRSRRHVTLHKAIVLIDSFVVERHGIDSLSCSYVTIDEL
jgi:hypothetical protein